MIDTQEVFLTYITCKGLISQVYKPVENDRHRKIEKIYDHTFKKGIKVDLNFYSSISLAIMQM